MASIKDDDDDDGVCSPTFLPGSPKEVDLADRLFPFRFSPLAVVVVDDDAAAATTAGTMAELLHLSVPSSA